MLHLLLLALPQGIQLNESVVTAPRSMAPITSTAAKRTVVSGEQLAETGERSLAQALSRATGVFIQETNLAGGAPVLRGLNGARILIIVDGVRINDSTTRLGPNQSLNTIDPAIVERVEIVRGPGSVLYGSDAIGGVISIWTRRRLPASQVDAEPLRAWDGEVIGTYNAALEAPRLTLNLDGAVQDHGMLMTVSGFDYEDFKAGDNTTVENTGYNGHAIFGAYEYALGKEQTLRLTTRVNRDFNVPRTDRLNAGFGQTMPANQDWRYSLQDRRGTLLAYTDERPGAVADRMQLRLNYHSYEEERDVTNSAGTSSTFSHDETRTFGLGVDWQAAAGSDHLLTWGVDVSHDDVDSHREKTDAGGTVTVPGAFAEDAEYARAGVFLQDEVFSFDPVYMTLGLRYSVFDYSFGQHGTQAHWADNFSALTASVEIARELDEGVVLSSSLAQGFHAPNLDDLANDGSFAGGVELANPNMKPEKSLSFDVGLTLDRERWGAAFAVFATRIDEAFGRTLIDAGDPGMTGDEVYQRANTGRLDLVGAEMQYRTELGGEGSPYSFQGNLAYVYGRHEDPSYGDGAVPARRVPPLQSQLAVVYSPEEPEWYYVPNARFSIDWASSQERLHPGDISDPRIDPNGTAGWTTYNLEIWGDMTPETSWRLGLLNLTDESYRTHGSGIDAQGRRAVISLRVHF